MVARAGAIKNVVGIGARPTSHAPLLGPGLKMLVMALATLPPAVVGLSAPTTRELASGIIAVLWFALLPVALYRYWAALALPFVAAGLLLYAVFALPFNGAAFIVDFWSAVVMLILALPKR